MPDIIVHATMGRKVYEKLGLRLNEKAFSFGLLGPDPFLFCLPVKCKYSSVMHRNHTGAFLMEMAKNCVTLDEFSYLSGFLCHYALDSLAHPMIVALAQKMYGKNWKGSLMHIAIEHRLDLMDGGEKKIPEIVEDSVLDFFYRSVAAVYGWKDARQKLRHGYRCMPAFYLFVRDRYGIMNKLFGWTKGPAAMISCKSSICDGLDLESFKAIFDRSVEDAVTYIRCAHDFINGRTGESAFRNTIGNKPYLI